MKNTNEHIVTLTVLWQYEAQNLLTNSSHSGTTHVSTTAGRPCAITNGQHWSDESHKVQRGSQKCQKSVNTLQPPPPPPEQKIQTISGSLSQHSSTAQDRPSRDTGYTVWGYNFLGSQKQTIKNQLERAWHTKGHFAQNIHMYSKIGHIYVFSELLQVSHSTSSPYANTHGIPTVAPPQLLSRLKHPPNLEPFLIREMPHTCNDLGYCLLFYCKHFPVVQK